MNWKVLYVEKFRNVLLYVFLRNKVRESSYTVDQLLINGRIHVNTNNLQIYNVWS